MSNVREEKLLEKAHLMGMDAGRSVGVTPMVVGSPTELFGNKIDWNKSTYHVADGVCGFAGRHAQQFVKSAGRIAPPIFNFSPQRPEVHISCPALQPRMGRRSKL